MGVEVVPGYSVYICDGCRKKHRSEGLNHSDAWRPPHWARLIVERDAEDFQGQAVADATIKRLLCDKCVVEIAMLINQWQINHLEQGTS